MKSENDLKITGAIVSNLTPNRTNRYVKFRLVHFFAHGTEPLYLDCILMLGGQPVIPKQGTKSGFERILGCGEALSRPW